MLPQNPQPGSGATIILFPSQAPAPDPATRQDTEAYLRLAEVCEDALRTLTLSRHCRSALYRVERAARRCAGEVE